MRCYTAENVSEDHAVALSSARRPAYQGLWRKVEHLARQLEHSGLRACFWGVRGTRPAVSLAGSRFGGNTTCLEIRYGRHILIIDAGSGIVALGDSLDLEMRHWPADGSNRPTLNMLFTHAHHDHLCGLPFFAPLYQNDCRIHMLGPDLSGMSFRDIVAGYMRSPYFPVDFGELPSQRTLTSIGDGMRLVWMPEAEGPAIWEQSATPPEGSLAVDVLYSKFHPRGGSLIYRVIAGSRSLVFATDIEIVAPGEESENQALQSYLHFIRGADVLVHDAQYSEEDYTGVEGAPTRGYGHSTALMAARVAQKAGVERLILFHHHPSYPDADIHLLEEAAREVFPATTAAREGAEIFLDASMARQI